MYSGSRRALIALCAGHSDFRDRSFERREQSNVTGIAAAQDNTARPHGPRSIDRELDHLTKGLELTPNQRKQVRPPRRGRSVYNRSAGVLSVRRAESVRNRRLHAPATHLEETDRVIQRMREVLVHRGGRLSV